MQRFSKKSSLSHHFRKNRPLYLIDVSLDLYNICVFTKVGFFAILHLKNRYKKMRLKRTSYFLPCLKKTCHFPSRSESLFWTFSVCFAFMKLYLNATLGYKSRNFSLLNKGLLGKLIFGLHTYPRNQKSYYTTS